MKKLIQLFLIACIIIGSTTIPFHAMGRKDSPQDTVEKIIAEETAKLMKLSDYKAVSGVIYLKGKVYQFHYGRLSNGKKPNNSTIYEIGSLTKTYTGLLLSQAVYDHKINLDDDVRNYLDNKYPNLVLADGQPITFRHLITHTSGLPLTMNCSHLNQSVAKQITCFKNYNRKDFFEALKTVQLVDTSGKNYHYSGVGTELVGYILENIYHMKHMDLLQKYVFSRSGEKQTFLELIQQKNTNLSIGKNSEGMPTPIINGFYDYSGGMKSSTSSMLSYIKMYMESNDPVVKQTMSLLTGDMQYGRAYAWNTYEYNKQKKMLYHNGSTFGHSSWIALYPNQKTGIFIVTNVVTADSQSKLNELSNRIIDRLNI
ncbi:beta-lactamase family protein [Chryseobacterium sp. Tr-659]|uniref:serine hydrolase domain-containing protein n=1 Tax=Chryseobacterium sp. Tr-659 TaxID=2608340 RepID=UPI00142061CF|nr:serine hydrolase domain-containing protein [Chryseobacterium sp. Tr-659]NIF06150.1 beta-lactamase family protein [Chryseobacterium sp. Tr-659]